jgi:hypothetical protein
MTRPSLVLAVALAVAAPVGHAHGAACPHFQILRVSMGKCFPRNSAMARAYAYAPRMIRARGRRLALALPPVHPPPPTPPPTPPPEPPFALPSLDAINWGSAADEETRGRALLRGALDKDQ